MLESWNKPACNARVAKLVDAQGLGPCELQNSWRFESSLWHYFFILMIGAVFVKFIYQPFFNLLVLVYQSLDNFMGLPDMGWAVIIFTVVFRLLILPLSLNAGRSEKEKYDISEKYKEIQKEYAHEPLKLKQAKRSIIKSNPIIILSETFDVFIQVLIALMLYRMFTSGLKGMDFHLLYKFVTPPADHFNLTWMNKYDLTHPNNFLNWVNTIVIFLAEFLSMRFSAFPIGRNEKLTLIILPIGAFIFFGTMPAGKKLFVITTLLFSIVLMLIRRGTFYITKSPNLSGWRQSFKDQIRK